MTASVSINVHCDCGTKFVVTPPKEIQLMEKEFRYFTLNCPYCEIEIGKFHFQLNKVN